MEIMLYAKSDCGCYVDGARGAYAPEVIAEFARGHGWSATFTADEKKDPEYSTWVEDEATDYMNEAFAVDGASWGRNEQGDWGLWEDLED